eukprot:3983450-Pyramimonas_sp.AAC.1
MDHPLGTAKKRRTPMQHQSQHYPSTTALWEPILRPRAQAKTQRTPGLRSVPIVLGQRALAAPV